MKKKMIGLILTASMVLLFVTGCGGSNNTNTAAESAGSETTEQETEQEEQEAETQEAETQVAETQEAETQEAETQVAESQEADTQESDDTVKTVNVGVIAWSTGMGDEYEFVEAVQTILSGQYADQVDEVFVSDAHMDEVELPMIFENMTVMWEGKNVVLLIVNDENGFTDGELLNILKDAEEASIITGVDHMIDGAPESTFVYDASDAAGCASMIMENAFK